MLTTLFLVVAIVLFILSAVGVGRDERFNLIAAGLAFFAASFLPL